MNKTGETAENSNSNTSSWNILSDAKFEAQPQELPTPEKKKEELTFEKMAQLSTEEYLELWKTLNPFYVAHATRQGIRDHYGMWYHNAGIGQFQNGMIEMLKDGKSLRTKAGANFGLMPGFTKEDVSNTLDRIAEKMNLNYDEDSPETAVSLLPLNHTIGSTEPWPDQQAVHFAQHTVLDELYGAETGNEAFVIYPTDVIVSQCKFGGHAFSLTAAQVRSDRKWNDIFVWPKEGKIPLDAGLVFLPKSQKVDKNTGSKYTTKEITTEDNEKALVPEVDEERIARFKEWLDSLTEESSEFTSIQKNHDYKPLKEQLAELGIPSQCINEMALNYDTLLNYVHTKDLGNTYYLSKEDLAAKTSEEISDYSVRLFLKSYNADLKLATDTVTAEQYWEQYFKDHPDERPKHIVYYDGDPSTAVREYLKQNGIVEDLEVYGDPDGKQCITGPGDSSQRDGEFLGFEDHYILSEAEDVDMEAEHTRFNELAIEVLRERKEKANY